MNSQSPAEADLVRGERPQRISRPEGALAGGDAPWARLRVSERRFDVERLQRRLAQSPVSPPPEGSQRLSAVLIPLYEHAGETFVILTRRSAHVRVHRREVSFPGGAREEGDADLWRTALRETQEEIGLSTSVPRLIGQLEPHFTLSSGSLFHPFVARLSERPRVLRADPAEVEAILHVSTAELLEPGIFREELWPPTDYRPIWEVTFFELETDIIWGATAFILRRLLLLGLPELDASTPVQM